MIYEAHTTSIPASAVTLGGLAMLLVTAGLGYIGGFLTSRAQARLEYDKWIRSRKDDVRRDLRTAFAQVATDLAALAHSAMWFTYRLNDTSHVDENALKQYKEETHNLISDVVGSQIRLAALSRSSYEIITPLISRAIHLSEDVDKALAILDQDPEKGRQAILNCNAAMLSYIKTLPLEISNLIGDTDPTD